MSAAGRVRGGVFVTIDGMGGAGKSTTTRQLRQRLIEAGYDVHATTQPSQDQLGRIARKGTDTYTGHALACLVAADRYHHLATQIHPQLAAGRIVLCDRYVASSYVLQRLDGVPLQFIENLNAAADRPDLAVILTADPDVAATRIAHRGAHSRFEAGPQTSRQEADLYRDTIARLADHGYPLLSLDTTHTPTDQIVTLLTSRIAQLAALPPPQ
ncbi:dTMP kinase [Amycolatopsis rhizosphaerae]|uniref:Thymidylate kinase n=1 Tax=Amycolatopsis rhizosphaerae TaxID=2053003 RepID=A0A558CTF7_9PSEU|nr:dTMP kinase [Amycolatopsis rhizosphaerae]TVT52054.1 dTMP kinase [Amycolatopsis rhizosphaerae]